jgi:sn-1 stearoyl-lipid 9-desaturase
MNDKNDASAGVFKVNSLRIDPSADQCSGRVEWDGARSIWNASMLLIAVFIAPQVFSWGALAVCIVLLEITMCLGHSIGFHRRLIHRAFSCSKTAERFFVWLGVLVGMQGPFWVIHSHDLRDWAQRQRDCHPYLRHGQSIWKDALWSLHYKLILTTAPHFSPGPGIEDDTFYKFLQRTWMLQQLPIALILYFFGGVPWVVWGVCVRVSVGVTMHWFVGYICHSHGPQSWHVNGGAVQAHNVPWAAIPSMGESWHNNHHAFPASARHGLYPGQLDIGYHVLRAMERVGLVWNINTPSVLPPRAGVTAVAEDAKNAVGVHARGQSFTATKD